MERRRDSWNGASHSMAKEAHEASIALLAYIDAPVTPERTCDHRLTAAELAVDSRSARAFLLTPSPFYPFSPSLSVSPFLSLVAARAPLRAGPSLGIEMRT